MSGGEMGRRSGIWGYRHWLALVAVAWVVAAALSACTNLYVGGQENNNNQVSGPGSVPSPSPGAGDNLIAVVKIGAFGGCPGVLADRTIKVGCTIPVTCTPKAQDGTLLPPSVTGISPDFFGVSSGAAFVKAAPWDDEAFNLNVLGVAPGHFALKCTVKGKTSEPWEAEVIP